MKMTDHSSQELKSKSFYPHVPTHLHDMVLRECSAFPVNLRSFQNRHLDKREEQKSKYRTVVGKPLEK